MLDPALAREARAAVLGEVEAPGSPVERSDGALEFGSPAGGGTAAEAEAFPEIGPAEEAPARRLAPNGAPSRLTERQWAQVRTPEFKARFGDWEAAAKLSQIENLSPVALNTLPDNYDVAKAYEEIGTVENVRDGRKVRFVNSTLGKILRHRGYDISRIVPQLGGIFRDAIHLGFEKEREQAARPDGTRHKKHPNLLGYHNYLGKFKEGGREYFVRFTVQEEHTRNKEHNPNIVHSTFVSDVTIYETDGSLSQSTTSVGERENAIGFFDGILSKYLGDFKRAEKNSSKIVDANGEPLPVWHGGRTDNRFGAFDPARISQREDGVRGFYFAPPARRDSVAGHYGHGQERAFWLDIRHPLVLGPDERPDADALASHDGIVRVAEEDYPERSFWNWRTDRLETERLLKGDIIEIVAFRPEQIFPVEGAEESGRSAPSETAAERKRSAEALEAGLDVEALKEEARPSYGSSGAGGRPESRPTSEMP